MLTHPKGKVKDSEGPVKNNLEGQPKDIMNLLSGMIYCAIDFV